MIVMPKNFIDRLMDSIDEKKSHAIVGLDPRLKQIPSFIKQESIQKFGNGFEAIGNAFFEFNKRIIDVVANHIPAIKPQMAFYEQYGKEGVEAFKKTVDYGKKKGLIVIEDAKRNDIGSTAKAYADGHLGLVDDGKESMKSFDVDAVTVNGYIGTDCINPFIESCNQFGKGIFVLVKTSNPSSGDLQDLKLENGKTVFELMASFVNKWGEETIGERNYSSVGAVVGATYPEQAAKLRKIMPKAYFLVPGYGAQGGTAKDVINCFNPDGYGAIINSSRGIIFAYQRPEFKTTEENFDKASEKAIINMKEDINQALKK